MIDERNREGRPYHSNDRVFLLSHNVRACVGMWSTFGMEILISKETLALARRNVQPGDDRQQRVHVDDNTWKRTGDVEKPRNDLAMLERERYCTLAV
ncbi:hypothetical protein MPTK1_5g07590 [Marchantia polymorpha subsp. ruderalis]|uniref:Uncharacterized protein n=2 Tax=Marchantia polymorpha TaxID=3197 RepID=A0AAF6BFY9_MARPO|nr:hypothetical protein MARPO_0127s0026 [Marchantia polymorpha]BBN10923.1 hypothetical protein Mp_5g07590 [Marchantia polymorpha subsp. ruderalis]|eukprot:PTQ30240.1 hypothetical protein MARPO_0127s0026 [Marchantia polymorpha]